MLQYGSVEVFARIVSQADSETQSMAKVTPSDCSRYRHPPDDFWPLPTLSPEWTQILKSSRKIVPISRLWKFLENQTGFWKFWNLTLEGDESLWNSVVQNHRARNVKILFIRCQKRLTRRGIKYHGNGFEKGAWKPSTVFKKFLNFFRPKLATLRLCALLPPPDVTLNNLTCWRVDIWEN